MSIVSCASNVTPLQQEEVHTATIIDLLSAYGAAVVPPCQYSFPVASTDEFLAFGDTITSAGISAIIGLADRVSRSDPLIIKSVSSVVTVESRHDAFFRYVNGKVPNPTPFDTGISSIWAYNLALPFIVPGSCPVELPIPILPTLSASGLSANMPSGNTSTTPSGSAPYANTTSVASDNTQPPAQSSQMEFSWDPTQMPFVVEQGKQLFIGWVNQLNVPVYTELSISLPGNGTADVPQELNGVAFAAVTSQLPNNADDLALATLAGPVMLMMS
jgi:hypothetical protein